MRRGSAGRTQRAIPRLRIAINKAKENNMPNDNIERGIKKGSGDLEGVVYEEVRYEGYGAGGVAVMVDCLTDNRNRTTPEIRKIFSKCGGNMGESGSVAYLFDYKGMIIIEGGQASEDDIIELLIEHDVEDVKTEDGNITVTTSVRELQQRAGTAEVEEPQNRL